MKKITASQAFSRGWEIFKQNALQHIGVFFLVIIISSFFNTKLNPQYNMIFKGEGMHASFNHGHISPFWFILYFIVQIIITLFITGYALDNVRGKYNGIGSVFSKYITGKLMLNVFIYSILISLVATILLAPGLLILLAGKGGGSIWLLIGLLLFLYIIFRLFFVNYLIVDGYDFADALKISWQKTRPYIGEIILFIIIGSFLIFLGFLALIVGVLVAIPVFYLAQAVFYNEAVSEPAEQAPATEALEQ